MDVEAITTTSRQQLRVRGDVEVCLAKSSKPSLARNVRCEVTLSKRSSGLLDYGHAILHALSLGMIF